MYSIKLVFELTKHLQIVYYRDNFAQYEPPLQAALDFRTAAEDALTKHTVSLDKTLLLPFTLIVISSGTGIKSSCYAIDATSSI